MSGLWAAYNKALAAQPLLVKAMTSFTGFTVGDILAQKFISPEDDYDFMRTLRLGGLLVAFSPCILQERCTLVGPSHDTPCLVLRVHVVDCMREGFQNVLRFTSKPSTYVRVTILQRPTPAPRC